jgi:hypothetical protein
VGARRFPSHVASQEGDLRLYLLVEEAVTSRNQQWIDRPLLVVWDRVRVTKSHHVGRVGFERFCARAASLRGTALPDGVQIARSRSERVADVLNAVRRVVRHEPSGAENRASPAFNPSPPRGCRTSHPHGRGCAARALRRGSRNRTPSTSGGVPRVRLHDVRAAERKLDRRAVTGHEDKGVTGSGMRPPARSAPGRRRLQVPRPRVIHGTMRL